VTQSARPSPPRPHSAERGTTLAGSEAFVQGTEVWVPDGELLRHHSGSYGPHAEFARVSAVKTFRRGEGLPGAVFSTRRPEVWQELGSHFVRSEIAKASGIEAAVGFPLFRGKDLVAVVVLLCGARNRTRGCVEIWDVNQEMRHLEHSGGYYGGLEAFGKLSRLLQFQSGTGLPGLALERGVPQVIEREGQSNAFIRASIARDYGIETGIAIPIFRGDSVAHVLVLLSTSTTPIARAFEVWTPEGEGLLLRSSHYATGLEAFAETSAKLCFKPGEGLPGRAFESGLPVVFDQIKAPEFVRSGAASAAGLCSGVAIPVIDGTRVRAVACLLS
jgi:hypothetical protein